MSSRARPRRPACTVWCCVWGCGGVVCGLKHVLGGGRGGFKCGRRWGMPWSRGGWWWWNVGAKESTVKLQSTHQACTTITEQTTPRRPPAPAVVHHPPRRRRQQSGGLVRPRGSGGRVQKPQRGVGRRPQALQFETGGDRSTYDADVELAAALGLRVFVQRVGLCWEVVCLFGRCFFATQRGMLTSSSP